MLKHKGTRKIETARLILRSFYEKDGTQMYEKLANDVRVTKFLRWKPHLHVEESKTICKIWEEM